MELDESTSQVFLGGLYDEAMNLLTEVRDYMADRHSTGYDRNLGPADRLQCRSEFLRLTYRLTHVMAWLLVQKAVHAGEMSQIDAVGRSGRLNGQPESSEERFPSGAVLSPALRRLLKRSNGLYARVARLDEVAASCRHMPGPKNETRR